MDLIVRKAIQNDIDAIEQFYYEVNAHLESTINYPGWKTGEYPARRDAEVALKDDSLFVALIGDEIVGSFILNHIYPDEYNQVKWLSNYKDEEIYIMHTFAVSSKYLKRCIGENMLRWSEEYAKKQGIKTLRLDCVDNNSPANKLYSKCDFQYLDTISLGLEDIGLDWFNVYEKLIR